jgi:hypothetical protein
VGELNGAIKELEANPNQLFLWEKITTQPHVTNQTMGRLDVFPTPWAPFVVVVSDKILEEHSEVVNEIINTVQSKAQALKNNSDSYKEFAKVYDLTESEVQEWLNLVHWSSSGRLDNEVFEKVKSALVGIGEIKKEFEVKNALHHLNQSKTLLV